MALDVTAQIEIQRDSKAVAVYAFEPTNDPNWIGGISQAKLLTPQPIGAGTQVQRRAKFLGRTIDYILAVRTLEPEHRMVMESIKSPFPMHVTYQFDALPTCATLVMVARHFLSEDELVDLLSHQPDHNAADARALVHQVKAHDYNPPKRDRILQWQSRTTLPEWDLRKHH